MCSGGRCHDTGCTKKKKLTENELVTQYENNKFKQEHRRDRMMSGGDQINKHMDFVG